MDITDVTFPMVSEEKSSVYETGHNLAEGGGGV